MTETVCDFCFSPTIDVQTSWPLSETCNRSSNQHAPATRVQGRGKSYAPNAFRYEAFDCTWLAMSREFKITLSQTINRGWTQRVVQNTFITKTQRQRWRGHFRQWLTGR